MDHYPLNTKFMKKIFFETKTWTNFRNSLKVSLSQDPLCAHNKQKNLRRAQCAPMANRVKVSFEVTCPEYSKTSINFPLSTWHCFNKMRLTKRKENRRFLKNRKLRAVQWSYIASVSNRGQNQPPRCPVRKGVLKNFANFTGKQLCWSLFSIMFSIQAYNFIKKRL